MSAMSKKLLKTLLVSTLICQLSFGQAISNTTGDKIDENNLTDQEKYTSENFIHEGKSVRILEEECRNGNDEIQDICDGRDPNAKKAMMVKALTQMYTMIVTALPDMGKISKSVDVKENDPKSGDSSNTSQAQNSEGAQDQANAQSSNDTADTQDSSKKTEEENTRNDYCRFIATGTETLALFQQQLGQDNIGSDLNEDTAQRQALEKAYLSHKERTKTAKIQFVGWGSTTACYVAMAAKPMATGTADWKTYLKTGAAAALTVYYNGVISDHEKYMKQVQAIKDKLPKAGDCNPITEKDCYCSEPTTEWDTNYCQKEITKRLIAENSVYVSCVDSDLKVDETCSCEKDNSCYDRKILNTMAKFSGPNVVQAGTFDSLKSLVNGELQNGKLSGAPDSNLLAIAQKALKNNKLKLTSKVPLTKDQNDIFQGLKDLGMDAEMAKSMAAVPYSEQSAANASKFQGTASAASVALTRSAPTNSKVITFSGGDGLRDKKVAKKKDDFNFQKYLDKQMKGKKGEENNNANVLKFAERAQQGAQITKDTSTPIFDIISRRYQVSGWRRLELQE